MGKLKISLWDLLFVLALVMAVYSLVSTSMRTTATLSYSEFKSLVAAGRVADVTLGDQQIAGTIRSGPLDDVLPPQTIAKLVPDTEGKRAFTTIAVNDPDLVRQLDTAHVQYSGTRSTNWLTTLLSWVLPALIFVGIWSFALKRMGRGFETGGGLLDVGKSKARLYMEKLVDVTFADVAGVDEAKEELKEIITFLRDPKQYGRLGARIPKGVLLVGPPGTGKTLLARAVAGEAGVPFFSISGSEFVELFVGVGAARVRDLFAQARAKAPCIIFIDELDALGRARGISPAGGGHDEKEQTLNQLLAELDGFDPSSGVVLLAATNRPEILDPALLRAGRFDRQILVDRPDRTGRVQILNVHIRKIRIDSSVKVEEIAALTPGFTGADLANLVNEAALLATRRSAEFVAMQDITNALERIVAGLEKRNRLLNETERRTVAYHECGHAIVSMLTPGADPVQKVSIIPRGIGALGYTLQRPLEDRFLMARHELIERMTVLLGGRAAEQLLCSEVSTGAADDLAKATDIARHMVKRYGMSEALGPVSYESAATPLLGPTADYYRPRDYAEATAGRIDAQVRELIEEAARHAHELLLAHRPTLESMAHELIARETLDAQAIEKIRTELTRSTALVRTA
jgi:cell division protease FtsH